MTDRIVALISLNFPPSQIASVHRGRHLAKHLPDFGWRPIVVAVDERYHKEPVDPDLGRLVPTGVEVHRVPALPVWLTGSFGVGDLGLRALYHLKARLEALFTRTRPDVVFFTGWPFFQMTLAGWIKRRFGAAVVLDFQDPWISARSELHPLWTRDGWSKPQLIHRLASSLEPKAVRSADFITSVSDVQNAEMRARYPWLTADRMAAIPIGGDPEDYDRLRESPPANPQVALRADCLNFSYVGTCLPRAEPLLRRFFRAMAAMRAAEPELASRVRFNFVGTSNQPNDRSNYRVAPIAADEGVGDLVMEAPQRVPFLEALSLLANSDALLLIGSDEPHYTASKIYPALMSGRPFLSVFHEASSAHAILSRSSGGYAFAFGNPQELDALVQPMAGALAILARTPEAAGKADPAAYAPYTARAVAGQYAAIFDRLMGEGADTARAAE